MSSSGTSDFGFFGITGASLALLLSGIEGFEGPIAGVRIASDAEGNFIFDPTFEQIETSYLDLTIAGTADTLTMVESQGKEVDNETMIRAFEFGQKIISDLCAAQNDFIAEYARNYELPKIEITLAEENIDMLTRANNLISEEILKNFYELGKTEFYDLYWKTVEDFSEKILAEIPEKQEE